MKNILNSIYSILALLLVLLGIFYCMMPQGYDATEAPLSKFSTKRALETVKEMTSKPHFVGSKNHEEIAEYLVNELQDLGLQPSIQEGFTMTEKGTLVKSKNILARIKGTTNSKALLLLSHYDSAPHSFSYGASDDASGVATILESIRTFLHTKSKHKNDIIILFSDAEELGLNGAALFVTQHKWAKEVGLALNFEARGSSGPSYMLMETNDGNAKMVRDFSKAGVKFPVSNSLMYSIYKMLPNDTDLTVFREQGKIQGFNFAFIDNHFNYHTKQDNYQHLSPTTLAHQGTYLYPLLKYFSNANLSNMNSTDNDVYFNIPFYFVNYPFSWILPMIFVAFILFFLFIFIGLGKQLLRIDEIIRGFVPLFGSLFAAGILTFLGWKLLQLFYPQYNDILQGFTYNGHDYIYAFVCLTIATCFLFYRNEIKKNGEMNQLIAPIFLWLLINIGIAIKLQGAGFLIIPVISSTLMLGYFVLTQKSNNFLNVLLAIPTLVIIVPFIIMFPIGLGLKILFGSAILSVLCFTLLLPILGSFTQKTIWSILFFLLSIGFFVKAHFSSDYSYGKAKPNSLDYILDAETNKAYWATYDTNLDEWTKSYLGENPKDAQSLNTAKLYNKYGSEFTFMANAPIKKIAKSTIRFIKDSTFGGQRYLKIIITPNRKVNRYDIFANKRMSVANFKANGVKSIDIKSNIINQKGNKLLSYYVVDNLPLELEFSIRSYQKLDMTLIESSFDLMNNPLFKMKKRLDWMMPKPFVLSDAIVVKQKLKPTEKLEIPIDSLQPKTSDIVNDSLKKMDNDSTNSLKH